ncbi:MAG: hypothetical protein JSR18_11735 [Proteobacteria bacterium]|nr:hypothetical protein [Pseudomonadota bacterium]
MPRRLPTGEIPGLVAADTGDTTAHRQIVRALDAARAAADPAQTAMLAAALLIEGHVRSNFRDFPRLIVDAAPVRDAAFPWRRADDELLVLSGLLAGLVYFGNDDPFLPTCVERLLALVERDLDVNRRFAAGRLLLYYAEPRELRVLSQRVYSVLAPARGDPRLTPHRLAHFLIYWTRAAGYAKEARQARQAEADVRELVARHGLADIRRGLSYLDVARSLPGGDVATVRRAVAEYEGMVDGASLIDLQRLEYLKTKLAGLEGQLDRAVFHAARATGYARELAFPPPVLAVYLVSEGQAHLALGAFDAALRLLREAVPMVPARFVDEIEDMIAFVEAWSVLQRGERETGLAHFAAAWRRVRERQFYDTFDGLPAFGARLCALALEQGIEVDFVRSLVQTRGIAPPPDAPESWPWPVRIRALGGFVVELLADGTGRVRRQHDDPACHWRGRDVRAAVGQQQHRDHDERQRRARVHDARHGARGYVSHVDSIRRRRPAYVDADPVYGRAVLFPGKRRRHCGSWRRDLGQLPCGQRGLGDLGQPGEFGSGSGKRDRGAACGIGPGPCDPGGLPRGGRDALVAQAFRVGSGRDARPQSGRAKMAAAHACAGNWRS